MEWTVMSTGGLRTTTPLGSTLMTIREVDEYGTLLGYRGRAERHDGFLAYTEDYYTCPEDARDALMAQLTIGVTPEENNNA